MKVPDQFAAKLLDALRPCEREVLGLRLLDQFSVPDIAHMLRMRPDSVSGHISKGLRAVGRVIEGTPDDAGYLLDAMGEFIAQQLPKRQIRVQIQDESAVVDVLPHRRIMGAAVRERRLDLDVTRYFIVGVNGRPVTLEQAEQWVLGSPIAYAIELRRELLAAKRIKTTAKFDLDMRGYFLPLAFGAVELYFERDFNHRPLTLGTEPERSIFEHLPPMRPEDAEEVPAAKRALRPKWLPRVWPARVVELGEYDALYDEQLATDAEATLRSRTTRTPPRRRGSGGRKRAVPQGRPGKLKSAS